MNPQQQSAQAAQPASVTYPFSSAPAPAPAPAPVLKPVTLPGVVPANAVSTTAPILLVISYEKTGKSTLPVSCVNFPRPGMQPLVLAADPNGPVSCLRLGYAVPNLRFIDMPGARYWDKVRTALDRLEKHAALHDEVGVIFTDCVSTLTEKLLDDAKRWSKNPDPRAAYNDVIIQFREYVHRLFDLNLPQVWLSWMEEPTVVEEKLASGQKTMRKIPGGPSILGRKLRAFVGGRADHILFLEKVKYGQVPGADPEGYIRLFHTRTYQDINAGGRFSHILPEPCPANVGQILAAITGSGGTGANGANGGA
jgi:hypothetical protein